MKKRITLESGINIALRLLIFDFFPGATFIPDSRVCIAVEKNPINRKLNPTESYLTFDRLQPK